MATVTLPENRRDPLLGAAISCFGRYGYRRTSMATIADAADVSRPALYQYFGSKEDIFRAAVSWQLARSTIDIQAGARHPGLASDRLLAALTPVVHMNRSADGDHGAAANPLYGELLDVTYARAGDLWTEFESGLVETLASILQRDADEVAFSVDAPPLAEVAVVLYHGTKGIAVHTEDLSDALRRVHDLVVLMLRGMRDR